jgi:sugar lactone lactonase YvrE
MRRFVILIALCAVLLALALRRFVILIALCAVLLALACAGVAAAAPARACGPAPAFKPCTLATFAAGDFGSFAESMAADSQGNLYVSLTTWGEETNQGEIWRIGPDGRKHVVASMDLTPYGMLTGVAVDRCDVYVAFDDFSDQYGVEPVIGPSVWKVRGDGTLTKVVAMPNAGMPNGLAFHGHDLYVTDAVKGAIWRARVGCGVATVTQPWVQDALLAPGDPEADPTMIGLGANGIAFWGDEACVSVSDYGRVVGIPVRGTGAAGKPVVVRQDARLKTADGMAFDALGRLWITTDAGTTGLDPNVDATGGLYQLSLRGQLTTVADDPGWLDYPTMPVFGTSPRTWGTLYIVNGAFNTSYNTGASPSVIALRAGVPGAL